MSQRSFSMIGKLFAFLVLIVPLICNGAIIPTDFDKSMGVDNSSQYGLMFRGKNSKEIYSFYKNLYQRNIGKKTALSKKDRIPKIIHHIWIGPESVPDLYKKYAKKCRIVNPGWQYKLWTQKEVDELKMEPQYRQLIDDMGSRYSGKKDIIEYLILYKYGGVVMDMDVECLSPLDELVEKFDFFAAMEPGVCWSKTPVMTNAVIGSKAGNAVFLQALDESIVKVTSYHLAHNTGIKYWFRKFKSFFKNVEVKKIADPRFFLMLNFADHFRRASSSYISPIVLPATYFNPIFPKQQKCFSITDKIKIFLNIKKNDNLFTKVRPETIAVQDFYD